MRGKEGHFTIHQKDINYPKCVSHNRASKHMKKKLTELKEVIIVIIVGNHNSLH